MARYGELVVLEVAPAATRRDALRYGSGAIVAALLSAGLGGRALAAQDASPEADAGDRLLGQYAVLRLRKLAEGLDAAEVQGLIADGFVPLVREIPGFVLYFGAANPVTRDMIYVGVYADQAGAEESTRLAGQWLADNGYDFFVGDPIVAEGEISLATEADETPA
jgi:hypothetical protein